MVAGGRKRNRPLAVAHRDQGKLAAFEALLDQDLPRTACRQLVDGTCRLHFVVAHDDALPRCEPVQLHHTGTARMPFRGGRILEDRRVRRPHRRRPHHFLRERLRGLDPGRRRAGPEARDPRLFEPIREPLGEGRFRTHHHEVRPLGDRRLGEGLGAAAARDAARLAGDPGVSGYRDHLPRPSRPRPAEESPRH